jgi:hypothetical protein
MYQEMTRELRGHLILNNSYSLYSFKSVNKISLRLIPYARLIYMSITLVLMLSVVQYSQRSVHQSRSGCIFLLFSLLGKCMEDFSSLEIGRLLFKHRSQEQTSCTSARDKLLIVIHKIASSIFS